MENKKLTTLAENREDSTVVYEYTPRISKDTLYQSEAQLEQKLIKMLQEQGYEYLSFNSEKELISNLRKQIENLNNIKFSDDEWERFFKSYIANGQDSVKEKTKKIQVERRKDFTRDDGSLINVTIFDEENVHNNKLQVINQYENEGDRKTRYDVSILVNGLPLVHVELKRRGVNLKEAFNQIDRYKRDSFWANSGLFEYIQIFVISNGTLTKYYSNTTRQSHINDKDRRKSNTFQFTSFWADSKNHVIRELEDFTKTFFAKHTLLNILNRYCVFTSEERLLVMRPYQIEATERILNKIQIGHQYKQYGTTDCGGYVWHTTGSGKTLTSFKTAQLATKLDHIDKVLFIVDRKDLDYQTMKEYDRFAKDCANSNRNIKVLERQLNDPNACIIITTIQKLDGFIKKNNKHDIYNKEVVLMFDECHRSQFGEMHKNIVKHFNKYYIYGFTGTPIFPQNLMVKSSLKTTEQLFGKQLHTYTIVDAVSDKNVLPFKFDYVRSMRKKDEIIDEKVKDIDTEEPFIDPRRITAITEHIINHFKQYTKHDVKYEYKQLMNVAEIAKNHAAKERLEKQTLSGYNSLFATQSIEAAIKFYEKFRELKNEGKHDLKIAMIYSFGVNDEEQTGLVEENNEDAAGLTTTQREMLERAIKDYNAMFKTNWDTSADKFQSYYKDISMRMKNRQLDILIVVNMFLTGFDAPTLNTLWVDKNLRYHGLIQAFSRTNRILNDEKQFGSIVSFRNLQEELDDALLLFGNKDSKGIILLKPYKDYYEGYTDEKGNKHPGYKELVESLKQNYPIGQEIFTLEKKVAFIKLFNKILKVRNILSSFDEFENDNLLSQRELQDYTSIYLSLKDELKEHDDATDKAQSIVDDLVFETELIKSIEVNIDYVLNLIQHFWDGKKSTQENKELLLDVVCRSVESSIELRNKKDLIEAFIDSVDENSNIFEEFNKFANKHKSEDLLQIINDEGLIKDKTIEFVKKAYKTGKVEVYGTEIPQLFPQRNLFSKNSDYIERKERVTEKLQNFFDRYFAISDDEFNI